jgi:AcrR family transcriptional regulator
MNATVGVHEGPSAGRRERKKMRTREALIEAAFTLFEEKGFDSTTVEEIADAVDVSSRTFFRYFSSKEDVVLTFQDDQFSAMMQAFTARPAGEPVITAMRHAAVSTLRACEEGAFGFDPQRFMCLQELMDNSAAVLARSLEHGQKKQAELTRIVADRMGVDPGSDPRPHVVAGIATSVLRSAYQAWTCGAAKCDRFSDALSVVFGILEEGLNFPSAAGE